MIALYRIDDRLIHGQVVVGWGPVLSTEFIVLVDDGVTATPWEQNLYRLGVPDAMDVIFATVDDAAKSLPAWEAEKRRGILLTGSVETMHQLVEQGAVFRTLNIGGIHARSDRKQRLRYVYLSDEEARQLRAIAARGVTVQAQDVPSARPIPLREFA